MSETIIPRKIKLPFLMIWASRHWLLSLINIFENSIFLFLTYKHGIKDIKRGRASLIFKHSVF